MIIGQVMRSFGGGGAQRSAINLATGLAQLGHESRILALGETGRFAEQVADSIPSDALGLSSPRELLSGLYRLRRLIKQRRFAALHVHGSGVLPLVAGALVGYSAPPSLHFTWHDSGSVLGGSLIQRTVTRWALNRCVSVSGSSSDVSVQLTKTWRGDVSVQVMRNGVPDNGLLGTPESPCPVVVWAARIVPEKRPEWFIQAAAAARSAGLPARFVLAGSSLSHHESYYGSIRRLSAEFGEPVDFVGWIENTELLYKGAAIGVQTSATEGLSMALLEQMMAGLAIVATDVGDTADAIENGKAGILVNAQNEREFTSALLSLLAEPLRRVQLATRARARAVIKYSCLAMAERCLAHYLAKEP